MPMRSDLSTVVSLSNANVVAMDIDGGGAWAGRRR
jgi:hypothetical protein